MAVQDRDLRLDSISFFACEKTAKKHQNRPTPIKAKLNVAKKHIPVNNVFNAEVML